MNKEFSSSKSKTKIRNWTEGSIVRNLVSISWPVIVSQLVNTIGPFIDTIWVSKLGASSIAGVGIAGLIVILANAALMGLSAGMRALIARFTGSLDHEGSEHVAKQALIVSILYSIIIAIIGLVFSEQILRLFGIEENVVSEGAIYLRIQFVGIFTMSIVTFSTGIMQCTGDTVTPMKISVLYRIVHIILDPFLIFGWWIFPRLEVTGAATASVIAQGVGAGLCLWILFSGQSRLKIHINKLSIDLKIIARMFKIGFTNMIMQIQQHLSILVLVKLMAPFGTLAVAGHTLWSRIDHVSAVFALAVGLSSGVIGGQNLGANKPDRAEKSGWLATLFAVGVMIIYSIAALLWAEEITGIFSPQPDLKDVTASFLRISVAGSVVLALSMVFMQFLTGVGDNLPSMLIEGLSVWAICLPLAFFLPKITDWGVNGVRWAMVIRFYASGFAFLIYFWLGRWKYKKV
jgi:putative MATE family efflux protein